MNVQLPIAVGLSPGQQPITPLDPRDDAPGGFAEMLDTLQDGAGDEPGAAFDLAEAPPGSDLALSIDLDTLEEGTSPEAPAWVDEALADSLLLGALPGAAADLSAPLSTGLLGRAAGAGVPAGLGSTAAGAARAALTNAGGPPGLAGQAQALLTDAGRASPATPPTVPTATDASAAHTPTTGARTLDSAPWFAVRAVSPDARGQALAKAVRPALQETIPLATRDLGLRSNVPGGQTTLTTSLGSAADVQAMADGDVTVRAPDLVARAVSHNVAKGAMLQAQRASIDLPQTVLANTTSAVAAQPVAEPGVETPVASPPSDDAPPAPAPTARVAGPPVTTARTAAPVPTAPLPAEGALGLDVPGAPTTPDAATAAARGAATTASAATNAALSGARPTDAQLGQVAIPDGDHMELKVSDGDRSFRLSIAREADGLNVELKAPREIVADLRALEPEIEAALAEDGYDLASFDAQADDSQSDGSAGDDAGHTTGEPGTIDADAQEAAAAAPVAPTGQGHIVNRLA